MTHESESKRESAWGVMHTIRIELPWFLYESLVKIAAVDQDSVEHFATMAVAEKVFIRTGEEERKAKVRADRTRFEQVLAKVPDAEPIPEDRLDR